MSIEEIRAILVSKYPNHAQTVGYVREDIVNDVLDYLCDEGMIVSYMRTGRLSWADIIDGIDFYAVVIKERYLTVPLSVTGPHWALGHMAKHPEVPVVSVDLKGGRKQAWHQAMKRILKIIEAAH